MPDTSRDNLRSEEPDREPLVQYEDLEQATGFTQISNAVLRCYPELSDGEKMTYAVLKSFAYVTPETFVGEETLARARSVTVSTVSRHLTRLVEVGLVKVRRRGQGKTNIWLIARIPRGKLEHYLREWRPNVRLARNPQTKTTQDPQIKDEHDTQAKTAQDLQAEEEQVVHTQQENKTRRKRSDDASSSTGRTGSSTASKMSRTGDESSTAGVVENPEESEGEFSTIVENGEGLAEAVAREFGVPDQQKSITGFITQYDEATVLKAFETVAARVRRGESIDNPIAYFYTVVKVMQSERDGRTEARDDDERMRLAVARNWARTLLREWSAHQVRAILADTYTSAEFVDDVMADLEADR